MTKKNKAALIAASFVLIGFSVFFFLKLQGIWDFSGRFGIREIASSRDVGMEQALIDGDELTSWGSYNYWEKPQKEDYLLFSFRKERRLRQIEIDGITPSLLVFFGKSDGKWSRIPFSQPRRGCYVFERDVRVTDLKIAASSDARELKWDVKEITFYGDAREMEK